VPFKGIANSGTNLSRLWAIRPKVTAPSAEDGNATAQRPTPNREVRGFIWKHRIRTALIRNARLKDGIPIEGKCEGSSEGERGKRLSVVSKEGSEGSF